MKKGKEKKGVKARKGKENIVCVTFSITHSQDAIRVHSSPYLQAEQEGVKMSYEEC